MSISQQFINNINRLHKHPYSLYEISRGNETTRLKIHIKQYMGCNEWEWENYTISVSNDVFDGPTQALVETIEKTVVDIKAEQERLEREEEERLKQEEERLQIEQNEQLEIEIYNRVKARIEFESKLTPPVINQRKEYYNEPDHTTIY